MYVSSGAVINFITSVSNTVNSCTLVAKNNSKSDIWRHFGLRQIDGRIVEVDKPVCRECFVEVCAKLGNTSNLYSHLKTKHPDLYADLQKSSQSKKQSSVQQNSDQPLIKKALLRGQKLVTNSRERVRLTKSVMYWLAKDSQPEYAIEKPRFKCMLKAFAPRYELPTSVALLYLHYLVKLMINLTHIF